MPPLLRGQPRRPFSAGRSSSRSGSSSASWRSSCRVLPLELDGLTIVHLSDFHLGTISFNGRALERALRWASERPCDIVAITGDLLSRRRGEPQLEAAMASLDPRLGVFAVLGNHDVEVTRDPFSQPTDASVVEKSGAVLLENDSVLRTMNGKDRAGCRR